MPSRSGAAAPSTPSTSSRRRTGRRSGTPPSHAAEVETDYHAVLDDARRDAETLGVDVETHTIFSHRRFEEIFDAAADHGADLVVMGWSDDAHGSPGRVEGALDDVTADLPCDFLVLKDRGFDPSRILVPTAGGPDSDLSAEIAGLLRDAFDSEVTLLHVAEDTDAGEEFLAAWAEEHGLADADRRVASGDVVEAIEAAAADHSLVVLGATERGLFSRLLFGTVVMDVAADVDCSVLLAERARSRGLVDRLFGE